MTDLSDDDALAAEFVVGTLDLAERDAVNARRQGDPALQQLIEAWQARLAPLLETIPEVEPGPHLRSAILARFDPPGRPANDNVTGLRRQLRVWRFATGASLAAAVLLAIWGAGYRQRPTAPTSYVAVLQQGGTAPAFLVTLDLDNRTMTVVPSAANGERGKSLQLWMVSDPAAPHSLGLLDTDTPMRTTLPDMPSDMISKATYAVTVEPPGGSPRPTSTPIYVGHLIPERL